MGHKILGLHHVTATVDDAQQDLDFYRTLLGLRLVKQTVNFDNHNVFHFYYGNERGTPGTIWTTFPYHGWGVPAGTKGAGQIRTTSFSIPAGSLDAWRAHLKSERILVTDLPPRFGDESLSFLDPSGLSVELVGNDVQHVWRIAPRQPSRHRSHRSCHKCRTETRTKPCLPPPPQMNAA